MAQAATVLRDQLEELMTEYRERLQNNERIEDFVSGDALPNPRDIWLNVATTAVTLRQLQNGSGPVIEYYSFEAFNSDDDGAEYAITGHVSIDKEGFEYPIVDVRARAVSKTAYARLSTKAAWVLFYVLGVEDYMFSDSDYALRARREW